jgi:cytochrome c-type biogenesis protein CcmH/NrfF
MLTSMVSAWCTNQKCVLCWQVPFAFVLVAQILAWRSAARERFTETVFHTVM